MKLYVIAGEASGDLHGANLLAALSKLHPHLQVRAWGGDLMAAAGAEVVKHYRDLAFMGFIEVITNLDIILRNFKTCKADILDFQPDALILIDYPGFNLRMAKWAKKNGIKVIYYISPQIWAWHTSRVHHIKQVVDKMLVVLPFEKEFYQRFDYEVEFVGHPLLDELKKLPPLNIYDFLRHNNLDTRPIIALLPGSRQQEISKMLAEMLRVMPYFADYQFVIAGAPSQPIAFYKEILKSLGLKNVLVLKNQTYDLLRSSQAALVTSGTATLETALLGVPQVVCYKGSPISYSIARRIIQVPFISLVNLIYGKKIVDELIQHDLNIDNLQISLKNCLDNANTFKENYAILRGMLGNEGASERAANAILKTLNN